MGGGGKGDAPTELSQVFRLFNFILRGGEKNGVS